MFTSCDLFYSKKDPFKESLKTVQTLLLDADKKSNGELLKSLESNKLINKEELARKGWIDMPVLHREIDILKREISNREGEELYKIAQNTIQPQFLSNSDNDDSQPEICLFCCSGCLDRIKKNHCIKVAIFDMGPGC